MKFDVNKLEWTREPESFTISEDKIEIVTKPHSDLWQRTYYHFRNDNAPVLQMKTEEKYFSFIVKTEFESKHRFDQCGIVMYLDSDNWLKGSIEYENDDYIDLSSGSVPMYRLYNPNSGEHFYTGSKKERSVLVYAGWSYEGVGFNFPTKGSPVYRLYEPVSGEHLYTMDNAEKTKLLNEGWNYEGVAFNSASTNDVPQYRLHNPNASCGAYHFTGSPDERDILISEGWEYQGIGFYSLEK